MAQVVTRLDIGGVPEHVLTLVAGLRSLGHEVTVVCREVDETHARTLFRLGVGVVPIDMSRLPHPLADVRAARQLYRVFREGRYDVVHTHMSKAALLGTVTARIAGVRAIVNTAHNLGFIALRNPILRGLFWVYDRMLCAVAMDAVITVSERVRDAAVRARLLPAGKVRAIRNGLDPAPILRAAGDRVATRRAIGLAAEDVLVLTVARLVWFKGLDNVITAVRPAVEAVPGLRLAIVGDGPLRSTLQRQAEDLGISENVLFLGQRRDVPSLLAASDLFVLASVSEGMPISVLEAMAFGRPVVATAVGGVPELVAEGETGLLVPPCDSGSLAAAIIRMSQDEDLRRRTGEAGRRRLEEDFGTADMIAATEALYRELVEVHRGQARHVAGH